MLPLSLPFFFIAVCVFVMCIFAETTAETSQVGSSVATRTSHFGPGTSVRIVSHTGSFRINEGETITLTCTASCLPACSFRWTCSGCVATRRADLTITGIQRDQAGKYTCLAYNNVSRGRADVTLDVLFPASVKALHFADGKQQALQVPEGRSVSISCQSTGNPPPRITWSVSGQPKRNTTFKMRYRQSESSVLMLPATRCDDNDIYTCTSTNGLGSDKQSLQLQVLCPPKPTSKGCRHGNDTSQTETSLPVSNLSTCVIARPRPNVTWYHVISDTEIKVEDMRVIYDGVTAMLETWTNITMAGEVDCVYRVVIDGDGQSYVQNFTVCSTVLAKHHVSFNVTVLNVTQTTFCVSWIPALSWNADDAAFLLTYSARSAEPFEGRNSTRRIPVRNKDDDVITHCVDGLRAGTLYDVVLSVDRETGSGHTDTVAVFNVTTQIQGSDSGHEKAPWTEVGASLGTCCLLLMLVVPLLLWKRRLVARTNLQGAKLKAQVPPLCICNENVRLSYLEVASSQSSCYVDATSSRSPSYEVSMGREREGSGVDAGRLLGVDDLSRRPSSTASANIYLDVLGDPATYMNQDEGSSLHGQMDTEMYEIPVTPHPTGGETNSKVAPRAFQHYIDMSGGGVVNRPDRHSTSTEGYDVAWCTLSTCGSAAQDDLHCELCKNNITTVADGQTASPNETLATLTTANMAPGVTTPTFVATPSIVVRDENGRRRRDYGYEEACPIEDEHIYDVIKDSDVED